MSAPARRRSTGTTIIAVILLLLALNALVQVALVLVGANSDPSLLTVLQTGSGLLALGAAWGAWQHRPWAPPAALAYGLWTAGMIWGLGDLLELPADERGGLTLGALAVLCVGFCLAWGLRHTQRTAETAARARR